MIQTVLDVYIQCNAPMYIYHAQTDREHVMAKHVSLSSDDSSKMQKTHVSCLICLQKRHKISNFIRSRHKDKPSDVFISQVNGLFPSSKELLYTNAASVLFLSSCYSTAHQFQLQMYLQRASQAKIHRPGMGIKELKKSCATMMLISLSGLKSDFKAKCVLLYLYMCLT